VVERLEEVLYTERLILREPCASDASTLFETYTRDPEVARFMIWRPHAAITETDEFIAACIRDWAGGLRRAYIVAFRDRTEHPIGMLDARRQAGAGEIGFAREARLECHTIHPNVSPQPRPCFMYARCK